MSTVGPKRTIISQYDLSASVQFVSSTSWYHPLTFVRKNQGVLLTTDQLGDKKYAEDSPKHPTEECFGYRY